MERWSYQAIQGCADPTQLDTIGLSALDFASVLGQPHIMHSVIALCERHFDSLQVDACHGNITASADIKSCELAASSSGAAVVPRPLSPATLLSSKRLFFNGARYRQWTALTLAACTGSADSLHALLATGLLDVNRPGGCGLAPLGCAVKAALRDEKAAAAAAAAASATATTRAPSSITTHATVMPGDSTCAGGETVSCVPALQLSLPEFLFVRVSCSQCQIQRIHCPRRSRRCRSNTSDSSADSAETGSDTDSESQGDDDHGGEFSGHGEDKHTHYHNGGPGTNAHGTFGQEIASRRVPHQTSCRWLCVLQLSVNGSDSGAAPAGWMSTSVEVSDATAAVAAAAATVALTCAPRAPVHQTTAAAPLQRSADFDAAAATLSALGSACAANAVRVLTITPCEARLLVAALQSGVALPRPVTDCVYPVAAAASSAAAAGSAGPSNAVSREESATVAEAMKPHAAFFTSASVPHINAGDISARTGGDAADSPVASLLARIRGVFTGSLGSLGSLSSLSSLGSLGTLGATAGTATQLSSPNHGARSAVAPPVPRSVGPPRARSWTHQPQHCGNGTGTGTARACADVLLAAELPRQQSQQLPPPQQQLRGLRRRRFDAFAGSLRGAGLSGSDIDASSGDSDSNESSSSSSDGDDGDDYDDDDDDDVNDDSARARVCAQAGETAHAPTSPHVQHRRTTGATVSQRWPRAKRPRHAQSRLFSSHLAGGSSNGTPVVSMFSSAADSSAANLGAGGYGAGAMGLVSALCGRRRFRRLSANGAESSNSDTDSDDGDRESANVGKNEQHSLVASAQPCAAPASGADAAAAATAVLPWHCSDCGCAAYAVKTCDADASLAEPLRLSALVQSLFCRSSCEDLTEGGVITDTAVPRALPRLDALKLWRALASDTFLAGSVDRPILPCTNGDATIRPAAARVPPAAMVIARDRLQRSFFAPVLRARCISRPPSAGTRGGSGYPQVPSEWLRGVIPADPLLAALALGVPCFPPPPQPTASPLLALTSHNKNHAATSNQRGDDDDSDRECAAHGCACVAAAATIEPPAPAAAVAVAGDSDVAATLAVSADETAANAAWARMHNRPTPPLPTPLPSAPPASPLVSTSGSELASAWRGVSMLIAHGACAQIPCKYQPLTPRGLRALQRGLYWRARARVRSLLRLMSNIAHLERLDNRSKSSERSCWKPHAAESSRVGCTNVGVNASELDAIAHTGSRAAVFTPAPAPALAVVGARRFVTPVVAPPARLRTPRVAVPTVTASVDAASAATGDRTYADPAPSSIAALDKTAAYNPDADAEGNADAEAADCERFFTPACSFRAALGPAALAPATTATPDTTSVPGSLPLPLLRAPGGGALGAPESLAAARGRAQAPPFPPPQQLRASATVSATVRSMTVSTAELPASRSYFSGTPHGSNPSGQRGCNTSTTGGVGSGSGSGRGGEGGSAGSACSGVWCEPGCCCVSAFTVSAPIAHTTSGGTNASISAMPVQVAASFFGDRPAPASRPVVGRTLSLAQTPEPAPARVQAFRAAALACTGAPVAAPALVAAGPQPRLRTVASAACLTTPAGAAAVTVAPNLMPAPMGTYAVRVTAPVPYRVARHPQALAQDGGAAVSPALLLPSLMPLPCARSVPAAAAFGVSSVARAAVHSGVADSALPLQPPQTAWTRQPQRIFTPRARAPGPGALFWPLLPQPASTSLLAPVLAPVTVEPAPAAAAATAPVTSISNAQRNVVQQRVPERGVVRQQAQPSGLSSLPYPALVIIAVYAAVSHVNDLNLTTGRTLEEEIKAAAMLPWGVLPHKNENEIVVPIDNDGCQCKFCCDP